MSGFRQPSYGSNVDMDQYRVIDRYDSTYWAGNDAKYYFNNFLIEEAIQCNYQIVEVLRPYYGYASYVADRLRHGTRIIQGELSVNFKRDGYLYSLLSMLRTQNTKDIWLASTGTSDASGTSGRSPLPTVIRPWGPNSPGSRSAAALKDPNTSPEKIKEIVTQMLQEEVQNPSQGQSRYPAEIPTGKGLFQTHDEGFDINIIYGSEIRSAQTLEYDSGGNSFSRAVTVPFTPDHRVATGRKLIGVSLMGCALAQGDDGRPVVETYTFMARDVQILNVEDLEDNTNQIER